MGNSFDSFLHGYERKERKWKSNFIWHCPPPCPLSNFGFKIRILVFSGKINILQMSAAGEKNISFKTTK